MQMVFDKLCRLSQISRSKVGTGSIANMQSNDTMKLWMLPRYLHSIWSAPFQVRRTIRNSCFGYVMSEKIVFRFRDCAINDASEGA